MIATFLLLLFSTSANAATCGDVKSAYQTAAQTSGETGCCGNDVDAGIATALGYAKGLTVPDSVLLETMQLASAVNIDLTNLADPMVSVFGMATSAYGQLKARLPNVTELGAAMAMIADPSVGYDMLFSQLTTDAETLALNGLTEVGSLVGRTYVIEGGSSGIGFTLAVHLAQRGATVHVTSRTEKIFKMTKRSAMASSYATAEFPLYRGVVGVSAEVMNRITHHVVDSRRAADVATFWSGSGVDFSQLASVVLNAQAFCASGHPAQYVSLEDDLTNRPDRFSASAVYDNVTGQIVAPISCSYEYAEGVGNEMHIAHAMPHLIASTAPSKSVIMTATTNALSNGQDQYSQVKRKKVTVVSELAKRRLAPHGIMVHIVSPGAVLTDYTFAAAGVHDWSQAVVTDDGEYSPPLPSPLLQFINADTPFNIPAYEYQYLSNGFYMLSVVGSQVFNQGIFPLEFNSPELVSHIFMQALQADSPTHFVQRNQLLAMTLVPDSRLLTPADLTPTFVERPLYGDFNATVAFKDSIYGIITRAEWDALNHYSHRDILKQAVLSHLTASSNVADTLTSSLVVAGKTAWHVI